MDSETLAEFRQQAVSQMNEYRANHSAPPLEEDPEINKYAQQWAVILANSGSFQHRNDRKYGENLFMGSGDTYHDAVNTWYNEICNYNFNDPMFASNTGHFTQLVWKSSKKVGIGAARSPVNGMTIVVANFYPHGNMMGHFSSNVSPN